MRMWAASFLLLFFLADISLVSSATILHQASLDIASEFDTTSCPIAYLGQTYTRVSVSVSNNNGLLICFQNTVAASSSACVDIDYNFNPTKYDVKIYEGLNRRAKIAAEYPDLNVDSICLIYMKIKDARSYTVATIIIDDFGDQSFFSFRPFFKFSPFYMFLTYQNDQYRSAQLKLPQLTVIMDMSGCYYEGLVYLKYATIENNVATCKTMTCTKDAQIETTTCSVDELCIAGECLVYKQRVCTVSSRSIMSFNADVVEIRDRCTYMLVNNDRGNFKLYGKFQERRRRDVPLLSELILHFNDDIFNLKQGSQVVVNGVLQVVDSNVLDISGVALSLNELGVTASLTVNDHNVFISFNGNSAHVSAPDTANLKGICHNTLQISPEWTESDDGCATTYSDPDPLIDCTAATKSCDVLMTMPFALCHRHLEPDGFYKSCIDVLCHYPDVDNIRCHLLEAYVTACNLLAPQTVTDWTEDVECDDPPIDLCSDIYCSNHEFCGLTDGGDARCFCRSIFASNHHLTNTFGGPVECNGNSAKVSLANCLLVESEIDYGSLTLNDQSCKGTFEHSTHYVIFSYDSQALCDADVKQNENHIIYENIIGLDSTRDIGMITRSRQFRIDFSCVHLKPPVHTLVIRVRRSPVINQMIGYHTYTLVMNAYRDQDLADLIYPNSKISLNSVVWVEVKAIGLDNSDLVLTTESCWMTPVSDEDMEHILIINSCANPLDTTVLVNSNGVGKSTIFSFNMFEFVGHVGDLNLHCRVDMCDTVTESCVPHCDDDGSGRARRFADDRIISMQWTVEEPNQ